MENIEYSSANEIMSSDVYIYLSHKTKTKETLQKDLSHLIKVIKEFEEKYSRFISDNFLSKLNESQTIQLDAEIVEIFKECKKYFEYTHGIFDPTIHNALFNKGYNISKTNGFYSKKLTTELDEKYNFSNISIENNKLTKPIDLKIDFGGIGKGFIIEKSRKILDSYGYKDFCISLGGDMYLAGIDTLKGYDFWAIEIENPFKQKQIELPTLLLKDISVATSGTYKRKWKINNHTNNHLIDTQTKKSTKSDIISCSVINADPVFSDVMAKSILMMGSTKGMEFALKQKINAVIITENSKVLVTKDTDKYIWKENLS